MYPVYSVRHVPGCTERVSGATHLTLPAASRRVPSLSPRKRAERANLRSATGFLALTLLLSRTPGALHPATRPKSRAWCAAPPTARRRRSPEELRKSCRIAEPVPGSGPGQRRGLAAAQQLRPRLVQPGPLPRRYRRCAAEAVKRHLQRANAASGGSGDLGDRQRHAGTGAHELLGPLYIDRSGVRIMPQQPLRVVVRQAEHHAKALRFEPKAPQVQRFITPRTDLPLVEQGRLRRREDTRLPPGDNLTEVPR
jgi:hypothetical protein